MKSLMFTFDDLQRLAPMAIQTLLRSVEKDRLPVALKGASDKIKDLFLTNMSERAGKMLRDDIAATRSGQTAQRRRRAKRHRGAGEGAGGTRPDRDRRATTTTNGVLTMTRGFPQACYCSTKTSICRPKPPDPEVIEPVFTAAELLAAREEAASESRDRAIAEAEASAHIGTGRR